MSDKRKETYNQKSLLEMGFTKSLINKFLPAPKLVINPFHMSGAKIKHWERSLVHIVMETEEFMNAQKKLQKRRDRASENVHNTILKEYYKTLDEIQEVVNNIEVIKIDIDKLRELTLEYNYNRLQKESIYRSYSFNFAPNEDTIKRWMVNYVRHELTTYDSKLFYHRYDKYSKKFYVSYKSAVLMEIGNIYPELKKETEKQNIFW